jgi:hypothetical protein
MIKFTATPREESLTAFKPTKETFTPIAGMSLEAMKAEYNGLKNAKGLSRELRDRRATLSEAIKAAKRPAAPPAATLAHARA